MNMQINWVPRLDAENKGIAGIIDPKHLTGAGVVRKNGRLVHRFDSLDEQVHDGRKTGRKMVRMLHARWQDNEGYDRLDAASAETHRHYGFDPGLKIPQVVFDAATDFVSSGLKKFLGPGEDVRRGDEDPFIFVPRPGSPAIIPSRRTLEPGHRSLAFRVREPVGQATFLEPNAVSGLQRANYNVEEKEQRAHWYGIMWGYNLPETWEADVLGEDILGEREFAANYALDLFREQVSGWGDADRKIPGYFSVDGALRVLGGQQFSGAPGPSAEQMLTRLATWEQAFKRANGRRKPLGGVASELERIAMQNTYFTGTAISAWDKAIGAREEQGQFPWLANIEWDERLNLGNAAGDAARWALHGGNDRESFIEHTETMLFGPFQVYMEIVFVMLRRIGGVVAKRPERFMYVDMAA